MDKNKFEFEDEMARPLVLPEQPVVVVRVEKKPKEKPAPEK